MALTNEQLQSRLTATIYKIKRWQTCILDRRGGLLDNAKIVTELQEVYHALRIVIKGIKDERKRKRTE